jgi:hypothetical protein
VEASGPGGLAYRWHVVGWRASGRRVAEVAEQLAAGGAPLVDQIDEIDVDPFKP